MKETLKETQAGERRRGVRAPGAARRWWIEIAGDEEARKWLRPQRRLGAHVALRFALSLELHDSSSWGDQFRLAGLNSELDN